MAQGMVATTAGSMAVQRVGWMAVSWVVLTAAKRAGLTVQCWFELRAVMKAELKVYSRAVQMAGLMVRYSAE